MKNFKVPHNSSGDHNPIEPEETAVYTDSYQLKGVTLKYVCHELNRASAHIVWEDIATEKFYRSDVYMLHDAIVGELPEGIVKFDNGLHITGDFGFEQKGPHVLLTILPSIVKPYKDMVIDYAMEVFQAYLAGELTPGKLKREAERFITVVIEGEEADGK